MTHAQTEKWKAALAHRCLRPHAQSLDELFLIWARNQGEGMALSLPPLAIHEGFGFPSPHLTDRLMNRVIPPPRESYDRSTISRGDGIFYPKTSPTPRSGPRSSFTFGPTIWNLDQ